MDGFIFDFNGTLFRDADKHLSAWKIFAREKCGRELGEEEYFKNMEGRNDRYAIAYLFGRDADERETAELSEWKEAVYRTLCRNDRKNMKLVDGAEELFDFLASRGIPRTIATSSCMSNVNFYVEEFGLADWFDVSKIIYDDGNIPGKPEPDFYIEAAKSIGTPINRCAVAEDSVPGVISAHRAGAASIAAVVSSERQRAVLTMREVSAVIHDFREVDMAIFAS
jgi:beta-phosphoglucomutase-like phosphatase (HAD superfamily)